MNGVLKSVSLWIVLSLLFINIGISQNKANMVLTPKEKKYYEEGKKWAAQGNFNKSNAAFQKLLQTKPNHTEVLLRLGTNLFQENNVEKAETFFLKAIALEPDFDKEMYYSLAQVQQRQKKFLNAADHFEKYLAMSPTNAQKIKNATTQRDNLRFIDNALKNPVIFNPKNLGILVNTTDQSEYTPSMSIDGSYMIFTRNVKSKQAFIGQEDLYISYIDSNGWKMANPITEINTLQNEGAFAVSGNGKYMIFTSCDRKDALGSCDLYYTSNQNGKWSEPLNMGQVVNSAAWDSQPTLSADGRTLIFSSKRKGSLGGSDLWMTQKNERNAWTIPVNLGNVVNTTGDDESPFLHPDGQTLYFRSNGRPGMGDFDIYYCRLNEHHQTWDTPINIGYPINTEGAEGGLSVSLDGITAFYSSDYDYTVQIKNNNLDIFTFELPKAARAINSTFTAGIIKDINTSKPVKSNVAIIDLSTNKKITTFNTGDDGTFFISIPSGKSYACIIEASGYVFYSQNFDLTTTKDFYKPYLLEVFLEPIQNVEINKPLVLNNIFFKFGSAELMPESMPEINQVAKLLRENSSMKIKITGHTDDIGTDEANQLLSEQRASSVVQAIIQKGIEPKRLTAEGKGEKQPIADNKTPDGQSQNRRIEMTIIKISD
jgi:outer membrane protein OmpA-like peptidoglycan-associated protein/Tol biopolymer transport system component